MIWCQYPLNFLKNLQQFIDRLFLAAALERSDKTAIHMVGEQDFFGLLDRAADSGGLLQDVDAISIVLDHRDDFLKMPLDNLEAADNILFGGAQLVHIGYSLNYYNPPLEGMDNKSIIPAAGAVNDPGQIMKYNPALTRTMARAFLSRLLRPVSSFISPGRKALISHPKTKRKAYWTPCKALMIATEPKDKA